MVATGVQGTLKFFNDTKGFGFINSREHGDVYVHRMEKEKARQLKVWETTSTGPSTMFDEICRTNPLEFDLRSVQGKPPVAANLRAPACCSEAYRAYRKQLVEHVVARHKVERSRAETLLGRVPGEMLKRVVEQFEQQRIAQSRLDTRSSAAMLAAICESVEVGNDERPPPRSAGGDRR